MKRFLALAGVFGVLLSATSAIAAPFLDNDGNIHFQEAAPNESITIQSGQLSRKVTANYCGLLVVPVPTNFAMPASIQVGADTIDTTTLPTQSVPHCLDNTLAESRPTNFKDASGRVVIIGKTSGISYQVNYPGIPSSRVIRANACGLARINNTTASPAPNTFSYNRQNFTTAALPTQTPSRCYDGIKFVPSVIAN